MNNNNNNNNNNFLNNNKLYKETHIKLHKYFYQLKSVWLVSIKRQKTFSSNVTYNKTVKTLLFVAWKFQSLRINIDIAKSECDNRM